MKTKLYLLTIVVLSSLLFACSDFGYYSQSINGHLSIMSRRQSIANLLADPDQPDQLKLDLQRVLDIRKFAGDILYMPDNDSFRTYAELDRPYAVWNVVAAPAYSLATYEWCFPVAGCLPYRGYFDQSSADKFADSLRERGLDTFVYGVPSYSTLGWFDDPVLSSFVDYPDWALAGLIFHELAHQMVYAENDGDFNEAFASAVEQEGVRRWLLANRTEAERTIYQQHKNREDEFYSLISSTRQELLSCYDGRNNLTFEQRQACKESAFDEMGDNYAGLKQSWDGNTVYDRWFEPGLSNARFITSHTYRYYIPAFDELLRQHQGDLSSFYQAAKQLAELPAGERRTMMANLRKASIAAISNTSKVSSGAAENLSSKSGI
jgi:predicted aminopeptidase